MKVGAIRHPNVHGANLIVQKNHGIYILLTKNQYCRLVDRITDLEEKVRKLEEKVNESQSDSN